MNLIAVIGLLSSLTWASPVTLNNNSRDLAVHCATMLAKRRWPGVDAKTVTFLLASPDGEYVVDRIDQTLSEIESRFNYLNSQSFDLAEEGVQNLLEKRKSWIKRFVIRLRTESRAQMPESRLYGELREPRIEPRDLHQNIQMTLGNGERLSVWRSKDSGDDVALGGDWNVVYLNGHNDFNLDGHSIRLALVSGYHGSQIVLGSEETGDLVTLGTTKSRIGFGATRPMNEAGASFSLALNWKTKQILLTEFYSAITATRPGVSFRGDWMGPGITPGLNDTVNALGRDPSFATSDWLLGADYKIEFGNVRRTVFNFEVRPPVHQTSLPKAPVHPLLENPSAKQGL